MLVSIKVNWRKFLLSLLASGSSSLSAYPAHSHFEYSYMYPISLSNFCAIHVYKIFRYNELQRVNKWVAIWYCRIFPMQSFFNFFTSSLALFSFSIMNFYTSYKGNQSQHFLPLRYISFSCSFSISSSVLYMLSFVLQSLFGATGGACTPIGAASMEEVEKDCCC